MKSIRSRLSQVTTFSSGFNSVIVTLRDISIFRELVDSLCRDDTDMSKPPYIHKACNILFLNLYIAYRGPRVKYILINWLKYIVEIDQIIIFSIFSFFCLNDLAQS